LLQNLVGHHNIGAHGFVRLEDADWNDGLDMAHDKGETVAFTHMYANNLLELADMISHLPNGSIELFKEMKMLLSDRVDLEHYFQTLLSFTGETIFIPKDQIVSTLKSLAQSRIEHLRHKGFIHDRFISYYNNDGENADSEKSLNLTGQAMALLSHTPTDEQAKKIAHTTKTMLFDRKRGGYALNTNYHSVLTNMGRAYGFAYGHKENGAVFSHMAMMYAYGLYRYHLVHEAREVWATLIKRAMHPKAHLLVGIPEYFTDRGIGMYPYLTGSASWLLKLIRTEVFGIQMRYGKLYLEPKLTRKDFYRNKASVTTYIFKQLTTITYHRPHDEQGPYQVDRMLMNGQEIKQGITHVQGSIEVYLR
jgi:cellobiose phosphorylase